MTDERKKERARAGAVARWNSILRRRKRRRGEPWASRLILHLDLLGTLDRGRHVVRWQHALVHPSNLNHAPAPDFNRGLALDAVLHDSDTLAAFQGYDVLDSLPVGCRLLDGGPRHPGDD